MDNKDQKEILEWLEKCPSTWIVKRYNLYKILGELSIELEKIKIEGEEDE